MRGELFSTALQRHSVYCSQRLEYHSSSIERNIRYESCLRRRIRQLQGSHISCDYFFRRAPPLCESRARSERAQKTSGPWRSIFIAEPRVKSLNVLYRFFRRIALKVFDPKQLETFIGCFSPDEALVDERAIQSFFQKGHHVDLLRRFCIRFPPLPLLRDCGLDVFLSRLLDGIPGAD